MYNRYIAWGYSKLMEKFSLVLVPFLMKLLINAEIRPWPRRITDIKRKSKMFLFPQAQLNDTLKTKADFMRPLRWLTKQDLLRLVISWADLANKIRLQDVRNVIAGWRIQPTRLFELNHRSIGMYRERIWLIHTLWGRRISNIFTCSQRKPKSSSSHMV